MDINDEEIDFNLNYDKLHFEYLKELAEKRVDKILDATKSSATKTIVVMVRDDITNKYTLVCDQTLRYEQSVDHAINKIMLNLRDEEVIDGLTANMLSKENEEVK